MDPEKAVEMVDENTICVAAILGSTLNGEFEDVKLLNDLLVAKNKETGYVSLHQKILHPSSSDSLMLTDICDSELIFEQLYTWIHYTCSLACGDSSIRLI